MTSALVGRVLFDEEHHLHRGPAGDRPTQGAARLFRLYGGRFLLAANAACQSRRSRDCTVPSLGFLFLEACFGAIPGLTSASRFAWLFGLVVPTCTSYRN